MSEENNGSIPETYRCWNCEWVIPPSEFNNLLFHTCFKDIDEETHCLVIGEDGLVSFTPLSKGKRKKERNLQCHKLSDRSDNSRASKLYHLPTMHKHCYYPVKCHLVFQVKANDNDC
ncbi:uncharacterized protein LOC122500719 [Leptopilina heterotoma]|uniref:uncharacterized protein LOC122500719 n=1 Tax=Leptopilina heterotoma TaxID=63436 RepID=UPI001CA9FC6B|nr:uncharacterized protein LOC122500719 [Leptopilina heterotoma]